MRDYIIMTDSCCDLNAHMAQELELNVVPLTVHMNGKDYANMLDGSEISFEEFYKNIRSGILSTTSAANVGQFEDAMRAVLAQGKDIVCINFSSALSATYQNACIAAKTMADEFPESHVYVVDSLSASLGQGLLLYLAVQKKREGLSAEELVQWVEENKLHIDHWFTVDDLNFLKMGGRVSATTAFLGTMLSIKPVMHTSDEGKLVPVSKARGRKASLQALIDKVAELGIEPSEQVMFICHADCEKESRAVAEELARAGFDVCVNCSSERGLSGAQELADKLAAEHGVRAIAVAANVADAAEAAALVDAAYEAYRRVDVLVNNAGITRDGLLARMKEEDFDQVIAVNLKGAFNMLRHTAGLFIRNRGGCIINIASVAGIMGNAGQCNYAASKAGIIGLTKTIARELAPKGIRCNAIAPGFIATDMTRLQTDNPMVKTIPLGRMGKAEDVAQAAGYLAVAEYVTGEVLRVDGGIAM